MNINFQSRFSAHPLNFKNTEQKEQKELKGNSTLKNISPKINIYDK